MLHGSASLSAVSLLELLMHGIHLSRDNVEEDSGQDGYVSVQDLGEVLRWLGIDEAIRRLGLWAAVVRARLEMQIRLSHCFHTAPSFWFSPADLACCFIAFWFYDTCPIQHGVTLYIFVLLLSFRLTCISISHLHHL